MCDYLIIKSKIRPYLKYYLLIHKEIPKHIVNIIEQTPPITLENTLALPLENFKIHGKTSQNSLNGKNLFDKNSILSGYRISSAGQNLAQTNYFISDFIKVSPNTIYTKNSPEADVYHRFAFYESNDQGSYISKVDDNNTATTPATCNYLRFCGKLEELNTTQLEEGSTVTTYEPYCGGQPAPNPEFPQPIQNVSGDITISVTDENNTNSQEVVFPLAEGQKLMEGDYLADDGIHHVKGQILLDGTEASWRADNNNTLFGVSLPNAKENRSTSGIPYGFSSHAKIGSLANARLKEYNFAIYGSLGSVMCWFNDRDITLNEFKTWLSSNNVTVEYELAEETLETFTEEQATKFEEIKALTGYNNITIVNATSSNLTPNLSFDYYAKGR